MNNVNKSYNKMVMLKNDEYKNLLEKANINDSGLKSLPKEDRINLEKAREVRKEEEEEEEEETLSKEQISNSWYNRWEKL